MRKKPLYTICVGADVLITLTETKQREAIKAFRAFTRTTTVPCQLVMSGWGDRPPMVIAHHPDRRLSTKPVVAAKPRELRYSTGSLARKVMVDAGQWEILQGLAAVAGQSATAFASAIMANAIADLQNSAE